ncbi:hypothetical protein HOLleu_04498 [Holothuria leucospilota]|uniref:Uncharacterized protein n=1 Tax=Holothuria leucospilota TaxID=206669 RepID=A0A9Q1CUF8_HOLLE|nr:hypothetical protein HOLleu_04498 [Holothuria leucospilota]
MVHQVLLLILSIEIGTFHPYYASAFLIDRLVTGDWNGVGFYISVEREAIKKKLDNYHSSVSNECNEGPRLFVPKVSVFPTMHNNDRHPVYVDFGFMRSHDFDEYLKDNPNPCVSTSGLEVAVTIPLLAGKPDGPPIYALALTKFYEKSRGDIPKINFLYPYIPVDEISLRDNIALVRNGSDEMKISFNRSSHYCKSSALIVKEEFNEFLFSNFQFGLPVPDYSFCDRHSFKSKFCSNAERIKCGVQRYAPNLCQVWKSNDFGSCAATVEIKNITSGFRNFILLDDNPVNILASQRFHGNTTMALKYPCQEFN